MAGTNLGLLDMVVDGDKFCTTPRREETGRMTGSIDNGGRFHRFH